MAEDIKITNDGGENIAAQFAKPTDSSSEARDKLLIIMVHGFPGHKNGHDALYSQLQTQLTAKGFHSINFDFRGCGESDGAHEDFEFKVARADLESVVNWAKKLGYERFMVVAEGLGAPLALKYLSKDSIAFVLLWPMLDLQHIAQSIFEGDKTDPEWDKAGYKIVHDHKISMKFINELKAIHLDETLKTLGKPLLVMHGAQDSISPIEQVEMLREAARHRRVEITSFHDGTHGLPQTNHRKTMMFHIFQFLEKYA